MYKVLPLSLFTFALSLARGVDTAPDRVHTFALLPFGRYLHALLLIG